MLIYEARDISFVRGHKEAGLSFYRAPKKKRLQRIFEPLEIPEQPDQGWIL